MIVLAVWLRFYIMKTLSWLLIILALSIDTAIAQPNKPVLPKTPPNTVIPVKRQSGNCPQTVGLWTASRYYEGGGENTVIADTTVIAAAPVKLVSYGKKFVEYTAPLKRAYISCVGQARSPEYPYSLRFQNRHVSFRVQLPPDTPANPSEFTVRSILGSRPYVQWAIAD